MPSYDVSPFAAPPAVITEGRPAYLFGSLDDKSAPTQFQITNVALASNVATITGTIIAGNTPAVGDLISVRHTASGSGEFNVTNIALTAVSITASTGQGTLSYALTGSNLSTTADNGLAIIPRSEAGETLANGASVPITLPYQDPTTTGSRTVKAVVTFPSAPTSVTVKLQSALVNQDAQFFDLSTVVNATNAGNFVVVTIDNGKFYRFNVSGLSGSGTIIAKLLV